MDRKAFFESIRKASPSANLNRENGQFGTETLIAPEESNPGIQGLSGPKGLTRRTNTGTAAYKGTFGKVELMHLLRRTLFGVKISDYNVYKGKTLEQAVDALLNVSMYAMASAIVKDATFSELYALPIHGYKTELFGYDETRPRFSTFVNYLCMVRDIDATHSTFASF